METKRLATLKEFIDILWLWDCEPIQNLKDFRIDDIGYLEDIDNKTYFRKSVNFGKSLLENGMIIETRNGNLYLYINGEGYGEKGVIKQALQNDDLTTGTIYDEYDVVKIYKTKTSVTVGNILNRNNLLLLHERISKPTLLRAINKAISENKDKDTILMGEKQYAKLFIELSKDGYEKEKDELLNNDKYRGKKVVKIYVADCLCMISFEKFEKVTIQNLTI